MPGIRSDDVRIPRHAREAVAHHETVVVFNRDRAVIALVHPDDVDSGPAARSRPARKVAIALRVLPAPDPAFVEDMTEVLRPVGPEPQDPWAPS